MWHIDLKWSSVPNPRYAFFWQKKHIHVFCPKIDININFVVAKKSNNLGIAKNASEVLLKRFCQNQKFFVYFDYFCQDKGNSGKNQRFICFWCCFHNKGNSGNNQIVFEKVLYFDYFFKTKEFPERINYFYVFLALWKIIMIHPFCINSLTKCINSLTIFIILWHLHQQIDVFASTKWTLVGYRTDDHFTDIVSAITPPP